MPHQKPSPLRSVPRHHHPTPVGFTTLEVLVVIALGAMFAGLAVPQIVRTQKRSALAQTTVNMKQLSIALMDFEARYGTFPSKKLYKAHKNNFKNSTGGDTANDLLGMLISGGFMDTEEVFYAKGGAKIDKKPDDVFNDPAKLLEPGECGMAYVMLANDEALSSTFDTATPVLLAPLKPGSGGANPKFNERPYNGTVVYLRLDMAVKPAKLDDAGKIPAQNNHTMFETGPGTIWDKKTPDVKAPK
jgi:type II secretory pathway pseudopilin PulG